MLWNRPKFSQVKKASAAAAQSAQVAMRRSLRLRRCGCKTKNAVAPAATAIAPSEVASWVVSTFMEAPRSRKADDEPEAGIVLRQRAERAVLAVPRPVGQVAREVADDALDHGR